MQRLTLTIQPLSAFATGLKGDTLFGQLCWAFRHRYGEARLNHVLKGYNDGQPWMIVSDAFPQGYIPKPAVPSFFYAGVNPSQRKVLKKKLWMPLEKIDLPLSQWQACCVSSAELLSANNIQDNHSSWVKTDSQPHNTINRSTGTTGGDMFAPYSVEQQWYAETVTLDIHILLDESRCTQEELKQCVSDIGDFGFGKDASIGSGKFALCELKPTETTTHAKANACLALAPSVPQGQGLDAAKCFYQLFTRFGRHGDMAVHSQGKPFKAPVLLAQTAGIFSPMPQAPFLGAGLGGGGSLSHAIKTTVHQGYAPIIPVQLDQHIMNSLSQLEVDV